MGFLVGNDFIPHLPHFHINKGALPLLYSAYTDVLPNLDGYLNENGTLNLPRFEKFMERLALIDRDHFSDMNADLKWLEDKARRMKVEEVINNPSVASFEAHDAFELQKPTKSTKRLDKAELLRKQAEINALLGIENDDDEEEEGPVVGPGAVAPDELSGLEDADDEDEEDGYTDVSDESEYDEEEQFQADFTNHKRNYYMEKLESDADE